MTGGRYAATLPVPVFEVLIACRPYLPFAPPACRRARVIIRGSGLNPGLND
jgi:hypothetical protein